MKKNKSQKAAEKVVKKAGGKKASSRGGLGGKVKGSTFKMGKAVKQEKKK